MPALSSPWIVETDWLAQRLDAPDIVVVDASLHLPNTGRNAKAEYLAEHIPGALFFDIEDIADEESPLPHMLPSTIKFASRVKRMGIGDGVRVIAYDSVGLYSAARAWWMFRAMGHNDVAVLNGGLKKWKAEGRPVEDGEPPRRTAAPLLAALPRRAGAGRRRGEGADRQPGDADRRCPLRRPLRGPRARPAAGPARRPHPKLAQRALRLAAQRGRHAQVRARAARRVRRRRRRHRPPRSRLLRLRRHRRHRRAGAGHPRPPRRGVYDGSWVEWGVEGNGLPVATGPAGKASAA